MTEEKELLAKRFLELDRKAYSNLYYTFTDFLGLMEQSVFSEISGRLRGKHERFGGISGAERIMIRFGDPEEIGYDVPFPIVCLLIRPKAQKFADRLTHRDFLGALLNLGIERDTLGDIVVKDNTGYIFTTEDMAKYIEKELTRVAKTDVTVTMADTLPEGELYKKETLRVQVSSVRLDAVIARVFHLSREDAQSLFAKRLVFAGGRELSSCSYSPKRGESVSVRGHGRFIYLGEVGVSKKGKLNLEVEVYK
ncbi:MAG: hypothetical protein IJW48_02435 [Clostridia bacterium]|nr:hypothetical protein [Clostridia bacterium]